MFLLSLYELTHLSLTHRSFFKMFEGINVTFESLCIFEKLESLCIFEKLD